MTITYANGQKIKAALVVGDNKWMRLVLAGSDDVTEFTQINGTWVSEDCEAVQIEFGWSGRANHEHEESDFVCSHELAVELIRLLLNPEEDEDVSTPIPSPSSDSTATRLMVA
jgi:hypothetical protein